MENIIEVNNLFFEYSGKPILENISFSIDKGDFLGIIGPNGSGKSTLVKLLLGIISPSRGEIKIFGENINRFRQWSKLGYVSQKAASFNSSFPATVSEIVGANLYPKLGPFNKSSRRYKEEIDKALEVVGMQDYKSRMIGALSGGQQQRVFIARVLVGQPEILFLDEPTVGVDAKSEEAVYCLLAKLNSCTKLTIAMISHDIGAVTAHATKLACMGNNGLTIHDASKKIPHKYISELYGHDVRLHIHKHMCEDCPRKENSDV